MIWDSLIHHAHWLAMSGAEYEQLTIQAARLKRLARQHNSDAIEDLLRELNHLSQAIAEELSDTAEHSEAEMATA